MEEEKPPRVSRIKANNNNNNGPTTAKGGRFRGSTTVDGDEGGVIECSGKFCRSCTAGLIADCVALCCCPCAVVHCFALAFVKAPWVVGKRCLLGLRSKNKRKKLMVKPTKKKKKKCYKSGGGGGVEDFDSDDDDGDGDRGDCVVLERDMDGNLRVVASSSSSSSNNDNNVVGEMESVAVNAGFEAEKVWLELYQIGHLDFGRVSFSSDQQ